MYHTLEVRLELTTLRLEVLRAIQLRQRDYKKVLTARIEHATFALLVRRSTN